MLSTKYLGRQRKDFESIDSTNKQMKENAAFLSHGFIYTAKEQTMGRGRQNRKWDGVKGASLLFSLLLKPDGAIETYPSITPLVGLCLAKTLASYGVKAQIKWPNDILIHHKKCCGILCESLCHKVTGIVVGVGVNLSMKAHEFGEDYRNHATSLDAETKEKVEGEALLIDFLNMFEPYYEVWQERGNLSDFITEIESLMIGIGAEIILIDGVQKTKASLLGLSPNGALLVRKKEGKIESISSGEISIRKENGYV